MKINSYKFGEIIIDGTAYTNDLVIAAGSVHTRWYRQEGHAVRMKDLEKWLTKECKRLIIGTGAAGYCKVLPEIFEYCKDNAIEISAMPTGKAIEEFNSIEDKSRIVAAFHLTC